MLGIRSLVGSKAGAPPGQEQEKKEKKEKKERKEKKGRHRRRSRARSRTRRRNRRRSSSTSSSSSSSGSSDAAPPEPKFKGTFFKRAALPESALTYLALPAAVIRETLNVIDPTKCPSKSKRAHQECFKIPTPSTGSGSDSQMFKLGLQ